MGSPSPHEPEVPLSPVEVAYQAITQTVVDPILDPLIVSEALEEFYFPAWAENSLHYMDCLDMVLPSDESILEAMCGHDKIYGRSSSSILFSSRAKQDRESRVS